MNDVIVSVRMPKSLAEQLREIAKRHHFMDVSEAVRSILRQKYFQSQAVALESLAGDESLVAKLKQILEGLDDKHN